MQPGNVNLDTTNSGWRTSWAPIIVGKFIGNGRDQTLLYDRNAGQADVVGFDAAGNVNLDTTNSGWRTSWDLIVVGNFIGNGRDQILLYDRGAGQADVVGFDATGNVNLDTTNSGWRTTWALAVAGEFLGNGQRQILLYDRSAGQADVVGFDAAGNVNLDTTNSGWRTSWDLIVAGKFIGNGRDQILLYDRSVGQADVVGFVTGNANLGINLILVGIEDFTATDFQQVRNSVDIMSGIYAKVDLLIDRVDWYQISKADSGNRAAFTSGQASDVASNWMVPNDSLDMFVVRRMTDDDGVSPVNGTCDKDDKGLAGSVVSLNGSVANSGNTFAHEAGHYLGLNHVADHCNFIGDNGSSDSCTGIFPWQGDTMKKHCLVRHRPGV